MAAPGLVGLHGDGLRWRLVVYPHLTPGVSFPELLACFRRFWCPECQRTCIVGHPGVVPRIRASVGTIAAAVRAIVAPPVGDGLAEIEVQARTLGHSVTVPDSERARSGPPRWNTLRRWVRSLERWWPTLTLVGEGFRARCFAFTAAIGAGLALGAFVEAAVHAHLRGGAAM